MNITKEEVIKIAEISRLSLSDNEIEKILKQLEEVLGYAQRVKDIADQAEQQPSYKNINVMRQDVVEPSCPESVLACAPEAEEHFFVVPRIVNSK